MLNATRMWTIICQQNVQSERQIPELSGLGRNRQHKNSQLKLKFQKRLFMDRPTQHQHLQHFGQPRLLAMFLMVLYLLGIQSLSYLIFSVFKSETSQNSWSEQTCPRSPWISSCQVCWQFSGNLQIWKAACEVNLLNHYICPGSTAYPSASCS